MTDGPCRARRLSVQLFMLAIFALTTLMACSDSERVRSTAIVALDRVRIRSSTAEAARTVGEVKSGDRVSILNQTDVDGVAWVRIKTPDGTSGWVQTKSLVDQEAFDKSHQLADSLKDAQTQAVGRSKATLKLRLTPDRTSDENVLNVLQTATELEILKRERRPRPNLATDAKDTESSNDQKYDDWFQVRVKGNEVTPAGWIYGGSIELQIPPDIIYYPSAGRKIVGWMSLGETKDENGRTGEHFLVLEKEIFGKDPDADFNRIKILAYDPGARDYGTPFREDLSGRYPVKLSREGRTATLEVPSSLHEPIIFQIQMSDAGRFQVTRVTPKEPVTRGRRR